METYGRVRIGELPKRPKGSDCKSDGVAFVSSNLALATKDKASAFGPALFWFLSVFLAWAWKPPICPARRLAWRGCDAYSSSWPTPILGRKCKSEESSADEPIDIALDRHA